MLRTLLSGVAAVAMLPLAITTSTHVVAADSGEAVTEVNVTATANGDRYTVTVTARITAPGDPGKLGQIRPQPPKRPGPPPGSPDLPRTTYYTTTIDGEISHCLLREEEKKPDDWWAYWYHLCTVPTGGLPPDEVARHPNDRPHLLATSIPQYIYFSASGAHVIGYYELIWVPNRYPIEKIDVRGGAIAATDPQEAALSVLANLPLPRVQLKVNPDLGLVNLPAWFWVQGYDGRTITHSENVFLSAPGQGTGLDAVIRVMLPGGRNIGGWCVEGCTGRIHHGVDIQAPMSAPVYAFVPGVITQVGIDRLGGHVVYMRDDQGRRHYYAHFDRPSSHLRQGQRVAPGDLIGHVGMTGNAVGTVPHVHFQITTPGGDWADPAVVLGNGVTVSASVEVRITGSGYRWDFGDGTVISASLGKPYPQQSDVRHTYTYSSIDHAEGFPLQLSIQFNAQYTVDGGAPRVLPPIAQTYSASYRVQEAQSVLTGRQ